MYKLELLPIAKQDMDNIIKYISVDLNNVSAARNLAKSFVECANNILSFPYGVAPYKTIGNIKKEYRCMMVKNFLMFYNINQKENKVTIVRVLYQKMNMEKILK